MSKSVKDQTVKAFQVGGVVDPRTGVYQVPGTGITGFQQAPGSTTGYTPNQPIQPYFQPTQFTQAQYQDPLQVTNIPTFGETVGSGFGQYDEEKIYVNDAGQILKIPFKDGRPLFPIPEGYSERGGAEPTEEAPATTIGLTGQTKTRDTGGGREDTATVTPTTKAARNVAKGYSKGYAGLSTAFNSGNGGLSAAAAQAKKDFGITGQQTGNVGSLASFVMAASGVPIGLAALTAGKGGYLTDTPVTPGAVGTVSYDDLVAIANGKISTNPYEASIIGQQTAKNVIAAQQNYAVTLSGKIGYNTGDINPVTGTPVRNGMAVNSGFGPGPTTASYASVAHMKDTIARGNKAGWRGGYISKDVYDNLSNKAKENYNNFDGSHAFTDMGFDINDIDLDDFDARQAAEEGFGVEDIEDMEVTSGRPSKDNNDAGDDFDDDTPSSDTGGYKEGPPGLSGPTSKEDNSGNGGHTGGSASDGSEAQSDGYGGLGH